MQKAIGKNMVANLIETCRHIILIFVESFENKFLIKFTPHLGPTEKQQRI